MTELSISIVILQRKIDVDLAGTASYTFKKQLKSKISL